MENFPLVQVILAITCFVGTIISWRSLITWRVLLGIILMVTGIFLTVNAWPQIVEARRAELRQQKAIPQQVKPETDR